MRWSSGDYQIAPIAARSTAMGRWRLMPPGYGGRRLRAGRGTRDTSSVSFAATCLPAGRSVRGSDRPPACQTRGPLKGKTNGGVLFNTANPQGEGSGDKKKRPGALLLALFISFCLFISFWWRRSGRSETGATGRRRGLRRGRRSWGCPWCRRSWCRLWGSSNSRRRREPPSTWP